MIIAVIIIAISTGSEYMKKPMILVTSAREALRYVMSHFCQPGVTEYPENTDIYAAISIQDTIGGGFCFELKENQYCKGVLTLYFDDIEKPEHGFKLIDKYQAEQIIEFINMHRDVDTLLIHCFAGISRSKAVGMFAREMLEIQSTKETYYNHYVYETLKKNWAV